MDNGIAVDLARRCHQEPGAVAVGEFQAVAGALAPHCQRLQRERQVVRGRGRTRKVEDTGHRAVHRDTRRDVGFHEGEPGVIGQVRHVGPPPRREVIDAHDLVIPGEELVAEVGPEEARSAEYDDAAAHRRPIPT